MPKNLPPRPSPLQAIQSILSIVQRQIEESAAMPKKSLRTRARRKPMLSPVAVVKQPAPEKNKTKYTCAACGLNVWAKPNVPIKCATDDQLMVIAGRLNRQRQAVRK